MPKDILKLPPVNIKAPNTFGKGNKVDKFMSAIKSFFSRKKK